MKVTLTKPDGGIETFIVGYQPVKVEFDLGDRFPNDVLTSTLTQQGWHDPHALEYIVQKYIFEARAIYKETE
jgi:hypothetical protein